MQNLNPKLIAKFLLRWPALCSTELRSVTNVQMATHYLPTSTTRKGPIFCVASYSLRVTIKHGWLSIYWLLIGWRHHLWIMIGRSGGHMRISNLGVSGFSGFRRNASCTILDVYIEGSSPNSTNRIRLSSPDNLPEPIWYANAMQRLHDWLCFVWGFLRFARMHSRIYVVLHHAAATYDITHMHTIV